VATPSARMNLLRHDEVGDFAEPLDVSSAVESPQRTACVVMRGVIAVFSIIRLPISIWLTLVTRRRTALHAASGGKFVRALLRRGRWFSRFSRPFSRRTRRRPHQRKGTGHVVIRPGRVCSSTAAEMLKEISEILPIVTQISLIATTDSWVERRNGVSLTPNSSSPASDARRTDR
jgi:hypothetical protein